MAQVHQPGSEAWLKERDLERLQRHQHLWGRPPPPSAWHRHVSLALLAFFSLSGFAFPAPSLKSPAPRLHASQEGLRATQQRLTALSLVIVLEQRDGLTEALQSRTNERDQLQAKANDLQSQVDQLKQQVQALQAASIGYGSGPPGVTVAPTARASTGANHFSFGYCTWWVANEWQALYGRGIPWFGNAIDWWYNARAYGYAEGYQPRVGAIMVSRDGWPWNPYGHVALVTGLYNDGSWLVSEMNFVAWDLVDSRHVYPGGTLVGFIY